MRRSHVPRAARTARIPKTRITLVIKMKTFPDIDVNPLLKGRAKLLDYYTKQIKWINWCEANGVSYTGKNGDAILKADLDELNRIGRALKDSNHDFDRCQEWHSNYGEPLTPAR